MFDKEYLKKVLSVQSKSYKDTEMYNFLYEELNSMTGLTAQVDEYGNIYVTKGAPPTGLYPCAVSHIDTVHAIVKDFRVLEVEDTFFAWDADKREQVGVGGDDKVGVYICLQLLKDLDNVKCVFFRDEEVGCIGSGKASMEFFNDVSLVLQADRRGYKDFIEFSNSIQLQGEDFQEVTKSTLEEFGYSLATGTITDVGKLKTKGLGVSCANVSCGYYDAHSSSEYVIIPQTENCYNLFVALFDRFGDIRWDFKSEVKSYTSSYHTGNVYSQSQGYWKNGIYYRYDQNYANSKKDAEPEDSKKNESVKSPEKIRHVTSLRVTLDEYEYAKEKLRYAREFVAWCDNCNDEADFYRDNYEVNEVVCYCYECFSTYPAAKLEIIEDYQDVVELYEEQNPKKTSALACTNDMFCSCSGMPVDDLTYDSDCRWCKLATVD